MMKTILIIISIFSINYAAVASMKLEKASLLTSNGNIELIIEADEDIMGIQFDMKYNTLELDFNGANSISSDYMFEYVVKDDGIIRGLMFSLEGEPLNHNAIESLISFDFLPNSNFNGTSSIEFFDVIIAGEKGSQLESSFSSININVSDLAPNKTSLHSIYPNPFNPTTKISYNLASDGNVSVNIFDALGRQIAELVNDFQFSGTYNISWDASNHASGTYFIRMSADNYTMTEKIILIK